MIPVSNQELFHDALNCLWLHKKSVGRTFKGRFIQIFLGLKFYQNNIPSMYSGSFIETEVLQSLLDDLYAKSSRIAENSILSLFENKYLARTGLVATGHKFAQNTWRNNFNLQKGIGCYAPASDLSSLTFLNQERNQCRYLQSANAGVLKGAHCAICVSGAAYRSESHRKWMRIDPGGNGYAVTDLQLIENFAPYLAPGGVRLPFLPLVIALYHDADPGIVLGTRSSVSVLEFMSDFNLSQQEFDAYFDASMTNSLNVQLTNSLGWEKGIPLSSISESVSQGIAAPPAVAAKQRTHKKVINSEPILSGTSTPPPGMNSGWEAEQFVAAALNENGWDAHVVARQMLGYDIFAQKGKRKLYVEVKSSIGFCSPSLTAREWQQAKHHTDTYILAIIENFNPDQENTIYWIPDPTNVCRATKQISVSYSIPRTSWTYATVKLSEI